MSASEIYLRITIASLRATITKDKLELKLESLLLIFHGLIRKYVILLRKKGYIYVIKLCHVYLFHLQWKHTLWIFWNIAYRNVNGAIVYLKKTLGQELHLVSSYKSQKIGIKNIGERRINWEWCTRNTRGIKKRKVKWVIHWITISKIFFKIFINSVGGFFRVKIYLYIIWSDYIFDLEMEGWCCSQDKVGIFLKVEVRGEMLQGQPLSLFYCHFILS